MKAFFFGGVYRGAATWTFIILSPFYVMAQLQPSESFDHARAEFFRSMLILQTQQKEVEVKAKAVATACTAEGGEISGMEKSDPHCEKKATKTSEKK